MPQGSIHFNMFSEKEADVIQNATRIQLWPKKVTSAWNWTMVYT